MARKALKKGAKYCCVVDCHNSVHNVEGRDPPVKFYRFPGKWYERERRRAWTEAVRRVNPDGTPWQPKENTRICSVHFTGNRKSDILHHPAYIPTIFPPIYHKRACREKQTESWDLCPGQLCPVSCCEAVPAGQEPQGHNNGCWSSQHIIPEYFTICCKFRRDSGVLPHHHSVGRRSSKCTARTKPKVSPAELVDAACQTCLSPQGTLMLLLSATDGTEASTQVSHVTQNDKAASTGDA